MGGIKVIDKLKRGGAFAISTTGVGGIGKYELVRTSPLAFSTRILQGRLIGIDPGTKYIGVAVSDVAQTEAYPLTVLSRTDEFLARELQRLITEYSAVGIVSGYLFAVGLQESVSGVKVKELIEELDESGEIEEILYTYWTENYSSYCLEQLLSLLDLPPTLEKNCSDKFAATDILQSYLDFVTRRRMK